MGRHIAITPLKLNSQRLPGKNFKSLRGIPLYQWSLRTMHLLQDEGVFDEVAIYGEPAILEQLPTQLRTDVVLYPEKHVPAGQDGNALFRKMMLCLPEEIEWCCIWNVTAPYLRGESVREAMAAVLSGQYDSAVSMYAIQGRLWNEKNQAINHDPATCPRTQTQEVLFLESEAFWILRPSQIIEQSRRVGVRPWFQQLNGAELVDIDTTDDWQFAEHIGPTICQRP